MISHRWIERLMPCLFLLLLFSFTWTWGLFVAPGLLSSGTMESFLAGLLPSVWMPTILALVFMLCEGGVTGTRREVVTLLGYTRGSGRLLIVAAVLPAAVTAIAVSIGRAAGDGTSFIPSTALPTMVALQLVTGAVGEELGWRGYLLPRLARRVGHTGAALIMAVLWALWHLPAFFTPGMPHQMMPMMLVLLFIAAFGLWLAFVFNSTGGSVIVAIVAHLSLNVTIGLGGVQLSSQVFWGTMAAVFGLVAIFTVIRQRT